MARVIKQGKCAYHFLSGDGSAQQNGTKQEEGKFNSLSGLVPPEQDSEGPLGVEEGSKRCQDEVEMAKRKAEALIRDAERQAQALKSEAQETLAAAKAKASEIESQAYAQGYEQGQKDGEQLGRKQFTVGLQHLESVLENLKKESAALAIKYEAQMVQTCLIVAGRLLERQVTEDDELMARVLTASLQRAVEGSSIIVHINPRDRENLEDEFLSRLSAPGGNKIEIRANASVSRGGCLIETEFGLIDATIESRWKAMVEAINESLRERTGIETDDNIKMLLDSPKEQ